MQLLFLGNEYNAISIACAESLAARTEWRLAIWAHDPAGGNASLLSSVRAMVRRNGASWVMRKAVDKARASAGLLLRRAGARFHRPRSLRELAIARKVPYTRCPPLRADEAVASARAMAPDLIVVAAFSQILRDPILAIPKLGCINVHPSLLPAYRGPNPFYWVLHNGELRTGVTVHYMSSGIDTGDIIAQSAFDVEPTDDEIALRDRSASVAAPLVVRVVEMLREGTAPRIPQQEERASYYSHPPRGASRV
jgi:folate-dependent phosphoribosylglycinamide formyltransferase PurN